MPITRYPRQGHPLAPKLLGEILQVRIPRKFLPAAKDSHDLLCDLDSTAWGRFSEEACCQLGRVIIETARAAQTRVSDEFVKLLDKTPPPLPPGWDFDRLNLEQRTYNCMRKLESHGVIHEPHDLNKQHVEVFLEIQGYGAKCLVDLLTSLEAAWEGPEESPERLSSEIVARYAKRLPWHATASRVRNLRLPDLPPTSKLADLTINLRTYTCLVTAGYGQRLGDLANLVAGDLLNIRGFGERCLMDFLNAVEQLKRDTIQPADSASALMVPSLIVPEKHEYSSAFRARNLRLPNIPKGTTVAVLIFNSSTYNCLLMCGYADRVNDLSNATVGDLLRIPGFGETCLTDYLSAVEKLQIPEAGNVSSGPIPAETVNASLGPISRPQFLEDELADRVRMAWEFRRSPQVARNVSVVTKHLGLDGNGGLTLAETGRHFGLTRERVRQICELSAERLQQSPVLPSRLHETLAVVRQHLPSDAPYIEARLRQLGLTRTAFRLEGLLEASKLFAHTGPFAIHEAEGRRLVVADLNQVRLAKRAIVRAQKAVSKFGVATIADIAGILSAQPDSTMPADYLTRLLEGQPGFEWLDKEAGWFWFGGLTRNRVVSRIRKILSVAPRIEVAELRSGIARHHQMNGYAPPRRVLLELCRRLPYCAVEDTVVHTTKEFDGQRILRGTELQMIGILNEHGPVMQRRNFEHLCMAVGMNRSTFYVYLDYSPIIERYGPGVYGIRGAAVSPSVIEGLIPDRRRINRVRLDHGWTEDRRIWIGYRLSEGMLKSGVFGVPRSLTPFLEGNYSLNTNDGMSMGTLVVKGTGGWGFGPLFRRRGGEPGDVLLVTFDSKTWSAVVSIGDESLLDRVSPQEEE